MPWDLTGNSGTNPANNFLGTTDNQPLAIRTNGQERMRIAPDGNVGIGAGIGTPAKPAPGTTLDVYRDVGDDVGGLHLTTSGGRLLKIGVRADAANERAFIDYTRNNIGRPLILQMNGGNVGIGTLSPAAKLSVNGDVEITGDIRLQTADCAEDFDVAGIEDIEPGTVVVIDEEGAVKSSEQAYDKRVAGVASGASGFKPGIILDKQGANEGRMPIALIGKVYCKVDARHSPIRVGDLLTTSSTPGHAMKADDPLKASGSIIGKTLQGLAGGLGLVPILVSLQ